MKLRFCIYLLSSSIVLAVISGCGEEGSGEANFAWSGSSVSRLDVYAEGAYCEFGGDYYAVLKWEGEGILGSAEKVVVLCMQETSWGTKSSYRLRDGIVLATTVAYGADENKTIVERVQRLKEGYFLGEPVSGGQVRLAYNGEVAGDVKSVYGPELRWLRFDVAADQDCERVGAVIEELYPLLEEHVGAAEILRCTAMFWEEARLKRQEQEDSIQELEDDSRDLELDTQEEEVEIDEEGVEVEDPCDGGGEKWFGLF